MLVDGFHTRAIHLLCRTNGNVDCSAQRRIVPDNRTILPHYTRKADSQQAKVAQPPSVSFAFSHQEW